jgi:hypothetical protein
MQGVEDPAPGQGRTAQKALEGGRLVDHAALDVDDRDALTAGTQQRLEVTVALPRLPASHPVGGSVIVEVFGV